MELLRRKYRAVTDIIPSTEGTSSSMFIIATGRNPVTTQLPTTTETTTVSLLTAMTGKLPPAENYAIITESPVFMTVKAEVEPQLLTQNPSLFEQVTGITPKPTELEIPAMNEAAEWQDPMENFLYGLDIAVPITAGVLGLILILLILGVKALRKCKLCWHLLSLVAAVLIKAVILIPLEHSAMYNKLGWIHGVAGCLSYYFLDYLQKSIIALVLIWICVDRLWFCYRPDVYTALMSYILGGILVAIVWILGFISTAILTYTWGAPWLLMSTHGGGGLFAGGGADSYNHTTCLESNAEMQRELLVDVGLYAVPSGLCLILALTSFGSCFAKRRLFYESRGPIGHALVFVMVLTMLYATFTFVRFYRFFKQSQQLLHAGNVLRMLRLIDIAEKLFYLMIPLVLLTLVQEVREGIRVLCRSCCSKTGVNERTHLMRPM